jgi:MFS family permease
MHEYWQAVRAFSPSLRRFLLSSALTALVGFGLAAVLQNLYILRLGYDARFIGLLLGVGQLVWAASALPAALISSRIGLRNGYLIGPALFGLGLALLLLVESQPASLWPAWLMVSQGVTMIGAAFLTVNIAPYLMAVTGERERNHAFAAFQALIPATAFLGSVIAGVLPGMWAGQLHTTLAEPAPYRMALWLAPILQWLAIVPLLGADRARIAPRGAQRTGDDRAPLLLLVGFGCIVFLQAIGEGTVRNFFNIYLDAGVGVPPAQIGAIMGTAQLLPILAALSLPFFVAKWGTGNTLAMATAALALCLLPLAASLPVWGAAVAYTGAIGVMTLTGATRDLLGQELVTPRWRTTIQSAIIIGLALGWATIGVVGGWLIDAIGFGAMFFAGAISVAAAAGTLMLFLRRTHRAQQPTPEPPAL